MLKWLLVAAGVLLAVVLAALAALPWLVDAPKVQAYVSHAASQALGRPVRFASLSVTGLPLPAVRLRGIEVAEDPRFGTIPFLTVAEGRVAIRLRSLLAGRVELADVTLDGLRLTLVEDRGQWNLASLGPPPPSGRTASRGGTLSPGGGAAGAAAVSRLTIVDGAVHHQKRGAKGSEFRLERINLTLAAAGRDVLTASGDAVAEPGGVRLRISDATLALAAGRPMGEAAVKASIDVDAQDVAALSAAVLVSPRLAGPLKGTLRLGGTASRPSGTGDFQLRRLTMSEARPGCPPPTRRQLAVEDLRVPLELTPAGLHSVPVRARASGGTVSFHLALAWQPAPIVTLKDIAVTGVELKPILVDYLCQQYAVTGPLELSGETSLRAPDPWRTMNGAGRFRIGPGKVVGSGILDLINDAARLGGALSSLLTEGRPWSAASPPDFHSITGTYRITNGVLGTDDLLYQSPRARLTAAGTYRLADGRVDMAVTLSQGRTQVRAQVSGLPGSVRVVPTGVTAGEPGGVRRLLERLLR